MRAWLPALFFLFKTPAFSQTAGLNNDLRLLLEEKNASGLVCDLLVQGDISRITSSQRDYNYTLNYSAGNIASIKTNINAVPVLLNNHIINYAEYIHPLKKALGDTMQYRNRLKAVKLWTAPLPQAYNGEGVLIGIIDTGTDFSHPDLKDSLGKTRIRYLWEQSPAAGSSIPQPYNYGIEWTKTQIDNQLCTHSDSPHFGHGTFVSAVAAGNGRATGRFEGCAPKAELVVVALDFGRPGPAIADALNYIFSKAAALGKPCVTNISVGDYYGSHDGTDLETQLIENMLANKPGRVVVAAAGNAGSIKYHVKTQPPANDTLFTWISANGGISYTCYGDTQQVKSLSWAVGANRSNFSSAGITGFKPYNYALTSIKNDTLKNAQNQRVGLVKTSAAINSRGVYELFVQISPDSANMLWRIETTGQGIHHAWNFAFVSAGLPGPSQHPRISKYAMPDSMYSMVSGFQCSDEVITVANYCNRYSYYDVTDTLRNSGLVAGEIAAGSSSGPTRDGRIKPDVAATGQGLISAIPMSMLPNLISNAPTVVAQDSVHVIGGGTSASSPVVAGLAALYLQRHPNATNREVRDAIRFCAYADSYTGSNLPDYQWGFGKLDGKASMNCGEGVYNALPEKSKLAPAAFPNPFSGKITVRFAGNGNTTIKLYDHLGALMMEDEINGQEFELSSSRLPVGYAGLIFITISNKLGTATLKIIHESGDH